MHPIQSPYIYALYIGRLDVDVRSTGYGEFIDNELVMLFLVNFHTTCELFSSVCYN
jgi:hypothetical protein